MICDLQEAAGLTEAEIAAMMAEEAAKEAERSKVLDWEKVSLII